MTTLQDALASYTGGAQAFASRADVALATIPAAVDTIRTDGYATPGDRGGGLYKRVGSQPSHIAKVQSADGAWWELTPERGEVTVEQFGGKADWDGATGTDNYAAFMAACQFYSDTDRDFTPIVQLGVGAYYSSLTIEPRAVYYVRGLGTGKYANIGALLGAYATRIITPINVTCWRVCRSNTTGETTISPTANNGQSSIIEGICFEQATQGTDLTAHGIRMRATADIVRCGFDKIAGDAIHIRATSGAGGSLEGDCNNWIVQSCNVHSCGGNGLYIYGADVNAGYSLGLWTQHDVGGCGILDNSFIGCAHYSPQLTGYGNKGVSYGGRRYALITENTTLGGTTTPGTNLLVWYDVGSDATPYPERFPAWDSGTTYHPTMPYYGASVYSTLYNAYVETSSIPCHSVGPVIGGNPFCTSLTPTLIATSRGVASERGSGHYRSTGGDTGHLLYPKIGEEEWVFVGSQGNSTADVFQRANLMSHRVNGWDYSWGWNSGEDVSFNRDNGNTLFSWGGPNTSRTYGRSTAQPDILTLHDFALQDPSNSNNSRIHGTRDAAPTTGYHAQGEVMYNVAPTAGGFVGWVCTTAGTPGTWKQFGAISA
jgi:hypothetical protein